MIETVLGQAGSSGWSVGDWLNATTFIIGILIAGCTAYLKLSISSAIGEAEKAILGAVEKRYARKDVLDERHGDFERRIAQLEQRQSMIR